MTSQRHHLPMTGISHASDAVANASCVMLNKVEKSIAGPVMSTASTGINKLHFNHALILSSKRLMKIQSDCLARCRRRPVSLHDDLTSKALSSSG